MTECAPVGIIDKINDHRLKAVGLAAESRLEAKAS
jgi:hypothetical protein